jgi:predicted GNAT family acetyltransferase
MTHAVTRNDERSRYELEVDGRVVGIADFDAQDSVLVLPHTEIDAAQRGRGLGALLVGGLLDDVRARGERVVPTCWYVREYMDLHPETADLLAD